MASANPNPFRQSTPVDRLKPLEKFIIVMRTPVFRLVS